MALPRSLPLELPFRQPGNAHRRESRSRRGKLRYLQLFLSPSDARRFRAFACSAGSAGVARFQRLRREVRFAALMDMLRDRRHEGWVLAAYPDPKTSRPLIGAGFSLDLPAREHPQNDPFNTHPFIEPSSAQLWQSAGLDLERLQGILEQYNDQLAAWKKKKFQKKYRYADAQDHRRRSGAVALGGCNPGDLQREGILPQFRPVHRLAADGINTARLPNGRQFGGIQPVSKPDQQ